MTTGEKIRIYRKRKGMTQKELGLKAGFTENTADSRIRKYEHGLMIPKVELLNRIATILDADMEDFVDHRIETFQLAQKTILEIKEQYGEDIWEATCIAAPVTNENIFGEQLKCLRTKLLKSTQKEFAEYLGIPQPTMSAYENGKNKPTVDVLLLISSKCNISIDWLCGRGDSSKNN